MRLQFLGATDTVTGSKYVLETGGHRVMVDCGLFQGYKSLRLRNWDALAVNPHHIDAVVLTHAHIDHSGYLPLLVRNGFRGPVYCTKGTAELCNILLPDSARLAVEDAQYANAQGFSRHHPALPLYDEHDAAKALRRLHPVNYGERFPVVDGVEAEFHRAGHIIGASTVTVLTEGRRIVFSGDLGRQADPVMRPPEAVAEADTLLVESTYGDRLHPSGDPLDALERIVHRTLEQGGTLLIPAFAVGRTQALLYCLYKLIQATARWPSGPPRCLPATLTSCISMPWIARRLVRWRFQCKARSSRCICRTTARRRSSSPPAAWPRAAASCIT